MFQINAKRTKLANLLLITKNSHTLIETQRFLHALTQPLKYSLGPKQNSKIEQCLLF